MISVIDVWLSKHLVFRLTFQKMTKLILQYQKLGQKTYLKALNYQGVLIIKTRSNLFALHRANVLLYVAADDHNLPFASILGDATVPRAALASCL